VKGRTQAELTGATLANIPISTVYASPLVRAQQTAELILAGRDLALNTYENLREINLPAWEGMTFAEVQARSPQEYDNWHNAPQKLAMGDSFPVLDLFEQAKSVWQDLLARHRGETLLLVAHSGINRALIAAAMGIEPARYHYFQQSNCGISILNFKDPGRDRGDGRVKVQAESLNITSHLASITGSPLPALKKEHAGSRILLVRHGETNWNRDQRFQGQIDVPLNPKGEAQGQMAAEFLKAIKIDRAFSSSMLRPKQTAELILSDRCDRPSVPFELLDTLKEISHGDWEGKLESEIEAEFSGELQRWQHSPEAVQMPNGENLDDVWARVGKTWQEIIQSIPNGETALVVAHDAVNKALLCQLFNLTPASFWGFKQGNGAVSVIDYPQGSDRPPILQAMNITTHLSNSILDTTAAGAL
jgi:phosphoserine phosphatase